MKKKCFIFLVFISFVLLCYPLFLRKTFGPVSLEQFLFHLMNPLKGTDPRLYYKGLGYAFVLPLFLSLLYLKPTWIVPKKFKAFLSKWEKSHCQTVCSCILFVFAIGFQFYVFRIDQWYYRQTHPTTLFRDYYVTQTPRDITFNEKRNAIVIYLESMENTYGNMKVFDKNYIPELMEFEEKNTSFDRFYQLPGTQWTIAGLFNGMCGIPLKIPLKGVRLDLFKTFLPSAICIPQILQGNGYQTGFIVGSDMKFSGLDNLVSQHGFDAYWGVEQIEQEKGGITEEMKGHGWGVNDQAMFDFAKEKITLASQKDKPFFYVLMTIDTHFPNGYFNPNVCKHTQNNFSDVVSCSSKTVSDFVKWIQSQPFAKDTTIVLLGDHITWGNDVYDIIVKSDDRQIINAFINPVKKPMRKKGRKYGTFDFAPSILSAMGANIPNNSFALGRDLFSNETTLVEKFGVEYIEDELQKYSPEYQEFFKQPKN